MQSDPATRYMFQVRAKHFPLAMYALHSGMRAGTIVHQYGLLSSCDMSINSPCSPLIQNTAPSSCIYFQEISGLDILTWFVVTHLVPLCEKKPNHRKKLQVYKLIN